MEINNFRPYDCAFQEGGMCTDTKRPESDDEHEYAPLSYPNPDCKDHCRTHKYLTAMILESGIDSVKLTTKKLLPRAEDKDVFKRIKEIKNNPISFVDSGNNIFITSPHLQNGRTTISLKIVNSYIWYQRKWAMPDVGWARYVNIPELLIDMENYSIKNSMDFKRKIDDIKKVKLVIWDDVTSQPLSVQQQAFLNSMINARFRDKKSNIFTGLAVTNIEETVGAILAQRLKSCEKLIITKKFRKSENISDEDKQYCL